MPDLVGDADLPLIRATALKEGDECSTARRDRRRSSSRSNAERPLLHYPLKRTMEAGPARSTARTMVWGAAVFPQGVQPPPWFGSGPYSFTDAGSAPARPLGVLAVEAGSGATVRPNCVVHLSVQKQFSLAASRSRWTSIGRPCGVGGRCRLSCAGGYNIRALYTETNARVTAAAISLL